MTSIEDVEAIEKLADLKAKGLITEDEFQQKKKQVLGYLIRRLPLLASGWR